MAPTSRSSSKRTRKASKAPRRTDQYKKKPAVKPKISKCIQKTILSALEDQDHHHLPSNSSSVSSDNVSKIEGLDFEGVVDVDDESNMNSAASTSPCSTPKAERFRIPKIETCPPAPKKQRVLSNCSLQRTPIAFFAPPDLELFFFFALRDISV